MRILPNQLPSIGTILSVVVSVLFLTVTPASALTLGGPSDCDSNAVVRCGAHSTIDLKRAYKADGYVQQVYTEFGITAQDIHDIGSTSVPGKVTNRGNVYIDGQTKPIATGAMTAGREDMTGSTQENSGNSTYYRRPTSASFRQQSLPAYVVMKDGTFQYAIVASCGNPVTATPVTPKPAVAPTPAPTPTPTPTAPAAPAQQQQQQQEQQQQVVIQNNTTTPAPPPQQTVVEKTVVTSPPQEVQPEVQTTALPNTGAIATAGLFGLFSVSSFVGYLGYRRHLSRILGI